jgi:hypothetical protein
MVKSMYSLVAVWKVDIPFTPGEVEVLEFLDEANETTVETLDDLAKNIEGFGPINIPFIFGFSEGYIRKTMMRTLLDLMQKKNLIRIKDNKVFITEVGRIALKGIEERKELLKITSSFRMINENTILLESGYYVGLIDRPFESDGIINPECYLGLHNQFVRKNDRIIEFIVPMRVRLHLPCRIQLMELKS